MCFFLGVLAEPRSTNARVMRSHFAFYKQLTFCIFVPLNSPYFLLTNSNCFRNVPQNLIQSITLMGLNRHIRSVNTTTNTTIPSNA